MCHSRMHGSGLDTSFSQTFHLVLHECNKWRDNDANAFHSHCRHLEGDALSTSCRHQSQGVVSRADAFYDFLLYASEAIVTPELF